MSEAKTIDVIEVNGFEIVASQFVGNDKQAIQYGKKINVSKTVFEAMMKAKNKTEMYEKLKGVAVVDFTHKVDASSLLGIALG